jgi:hypothetical protein
MMIAFLEQGRRDFGLRNAGVSPAGGRMMSICLVTFAVICAGTVVFMATLGTAETADIADGRGGFLFGHRRDMTVLHTIHKQVCW